MFNRFLITACGRSGTKFLATVMNRSKVWTVLHEPDAPFFQTVTAANRPLLQLAAHSRFRNTQHYGEVNSLLRNVIKPVFNKNNEGKRTLMRAPRDFEVDLFGVILRNPYEIIASILNRREKQTWEHELTAFCGDLQTIEWAMREKNYLRIYFSKMVSDVDYLQDLLGTFGIRDVVVDESILEHKVNACVERKYSIKDLSAKQLEIVKPVCDPFLEKYL